MAMVTDKTHPILAETKKRDHMQVYIDQTNGLWIRANTTKDEIELWYDGVLQSSWINQAWSPDLMVTIGRVAIKIGENKRSDEIRSTIKKLIGDLT